MGLETDAMPGTRVCYKDSPDQALAIRLIAIWRRGDIDAPIMSASSGPKAYMKNDVYAVFESNPAIDAVLMVRGHGPPFFLLRVGRKYFDVSKREVEVESAEELCSSSG
jgi:hypothetical protein